LSSPDVVGALVPAVASTLENTVLAFNPIKKPRLTHDEVHIYHYKETFTFSLCLFFTTKLLWETSQKKNWFKSIRSSGGLKMCERKKKKEEKKKGKSSCK